jgi:hypothetical protein
VATYKVKAVCDFCGKETLIAPSLYLKHEKHYCCKECQNKGAIKFGISRGENNGRYNSKNIKCTNCGKEFKAPKYIQEQTNSYGENNHYCCRKCYAEYRSKHFIGDKCGMTGKKYTGEKLKEMSKITTKRICDGKFKQTMTKPHIKINKVLDDINVLYTNEFNLKYHALDIYLDDYNLGIEVMGDYWHGNPNKYSYEKLGKIQLKSKKQDKSKHAYTKKYHNFEILYLWESEINNNINLCSLLIEKYIETNGVLQDYNSFNYYVNDDEILLKSDIVYPHFIKSNP